MATPGVKQLGVTPPLSEAMPSKEEVTASALLVDELKRQNNYETEAEVNKRYVKDPIISLINSLF